MERKTLVDPQDGNGCLVGPVSTGLNHDKAVLEVSTGGPARAGLSPASDVLRLGKGGYRGDVTEDSVGMKVGETDSQVGLAREGINLTSGPTGNDPVGDRVVSASAGPNPGFATGNTDKTIINY
jgi:hypothetical protein